METINNPTKRVYRRAARAGFTLVESLVVLVVLTIGILSIARIFPGGLLITKRTAEQITGDRFGQKMLADLEQDPGMPESIIALRADSAGQFQPDGTLLPDIFDTTAYGWGGDGAGYNDPKFFTDVNRAKRVLGEPLRIPVASAGTAEGYGAAFMLKYAPIYYNPDLQTVQNNLVVYGLTMQRTIQSSVATPANPAPAAVLPNENVYALDVDDPAAPKIAFYPRAKAGRTNPFRLFRVSFRYYAQTAEGWRVKTAIVTIRVDDVDPVGNTLEPLWMPLLGPNALTIITDFTQIVRDSDDVSRQFKMVNTAPVVNPPPFSDDPYEFAIASIQARYGDDQPVQVANTGILLFNPIGYKNWIQTSRGIQAPLARVDYTIFDNHIIRDDLSVPRSGPYTVRLSFGNILQTGDVIDTPSKGGGSIPLGYNGMFNQLDATADVTVIDTNTGEIVAEQIANPANGLPGQRAGTVPFRLNAKAGLITFLPENAGQESKIKGRNVRILYKTLSDWGAGIVKAHGHYYKADTASGLDYNTYYVGGTVSGDGLDTKKLYFSRSEAGKSVIADINVVYTNTTTSAKRFETLNNQELLIGNDPKKFALLNGQQVPFYELPQPPGEVAEFDFSQNGYAIRDVHGSSATARVVWRDTGRWRKRDTQSSLVAPSNR